MTCLAALRGNEQHKKNSTFSVLLLNPVQTIQTIQSIVSFILYSSIKTMCTHIPLSVIHTNWHNFIYTNIIYFPKPERDSKKKKKKKHKIKSHPETCWTLCATHTCAWELLHQNLTYSTKCCSILKEIAQKMRAWRQMTLTSKCSLS